MTSILTRIVSLLICMAFLGSLVGCQGDGNNDIKTVGATALSLAAAGFTGNFDVEARPDGELYLVEGAGLRSPGSRVGVHGSMNPAAVDSERLEKLMALLERISAIEATPTPTTPDAGTEP